VNEAWTVGELVEEVAARLAVLPLQKNGQIRSVPDERTIRYYGTLGLLDRPAMRGRTALYGVRHLAQVVAIKRLQQAGRSLAEIQAMWGQLTDETLASLSGVEVPARGRAPARKEFWKRGDAAAEPELSAPGTGAGPAPRAAMTSPITAPPAELRVQLAPNVILTIAMPEDGGALALSHADIRALRAAAAPLVAELADRQLTPHAGEEEP
jgi:DNA-binding transcriptional MerR regulator